MRLDRSDRTERPSVVHEPGPGPETPQGRGAEVVRWGRAYGDAVRRADVVEQEVPVRMEDLLRREERLHMTGTATDAQKDPLAGAYLVGAGLRRPTGSLGCAHEAGVGV